MLPAEPCGRSAIVVNAMEPPTGEIDHAVASSRSLRGTPLSNETVQVLGRKFGPRGAGKFATARNLVLSLNQGPTRQSTGLSFRLSGWGIFRISPVSMSFM